MTCKNCGTQIADKALICYRCGQATFEAQRKPASVSPRRRWWLSAELLGVVLIVLTLGALVSGYTSTTHPYDYIPWAVMAVGAVIVAWGVLARRRRRR
jgi:hypothetical protein